MEIDEETVRALGELPGIEVINADFLLWESDERYDLIVGNPPYGIPSEDAHYPIRVRREIREEYRRRFRTWYGKYNLYGAFIEKAVGLLKPGGQLLFVVPATFMILREFRLLREFLSVSGEVEITYLGSDVFRPYAQVSVVILSLAKGEDRGRLKLYEYVEGRRRLIYSLLNYRGEVITFRTDFTRRLEGRSRSRLGDEFAVRISPRTPEIRRSKEVVESRTAPGEGFVPILNGRNLHIRAIDYSPRTGYWIRYERREVLRDFFRLPRVVVGLGFRRGGHLAAAYDRRAYPWMGDVYHLIGRRRMLFNGGGVSADALVRYLTSRTVARYIRETYRDITYHLNVDMIERIPLPSEGEIRRILREEGDEHLEG